jgi:hypothetical protein
VRATAMPRKARGCPRALSPRNFSPLFLSTVHLQ